MRCPRCDEPIPINPGAIFYCHNPKHCYFVEHKMPEARDPLLVEREKTHGSFQRMATIAQQLKATIEHETVSLDSRQREALQMICTKLARVACGDPKHKDTWDDIAGYAKLGSEACE